MVRYLSEQGLQAESFHTEYGDDPVEEKVEARPGPSEVPAGEGA
jgi:hypothetical protein